MPLGIPHSAFLAWDEADRDAALAYRREMAARCDGCGTRPDEWEADPNAYIGDFYTCPGCLRLEEERDNIGENKRGVHTRLLPAHVALARIEADPSTFVTTPQDDEAP